jgi:hypothetical protein
MKAALILALLAASAVQSPGETPQFDLSGYNSRFNRIQKTGMLILGSWAATNFIGNGLPLIAIPNASLDENLRYFMLMNMGWNVINAALAGVGYFSCCRKEPEEFTLADAIKRQYRTEKIFLFNAGLDVGYIAFGLFLFERSVTSTNPSLLTGLGYSLILQGSVLFLFDLAMQLAHGRHRRSLDEYLSYL